MATLVIRNVEDSLHAELKARAAVHGRSMEEEVRDVLRNAVAQDSATATGGLASAIRALFQPLGGVDLPEIERGPGREPPDFSGPEWGPDG
jgi:plasmid stability protein